MLIGELYEIKESPEVTAKRAANFKQGFLTLAEFNRFEAQATSHYGLLCAITQERRQPHGYQSIGHFLTEKGILEKHVLSCGRDEGDAESRKSIKAVSNLKIQYSVH